MVNNSHLEVSIKINPIVQELVSDFMMEELGCSGIVLEETRYKDLKIVSEERDIIKGYLWINPDNPLTEAELRNIIAKKKKQFVKNGISEDNLGSWDVSFANTPEEQWAHNWKKFWHPMKIGNRIVVCPSWEEYSPSENEIIIELDPGSAFGTGTHQTTRLCMIAMEKYLKKGDNIADVGMGSGILSIAGLKLGAKKAVGVDNDPSVIEVAKDNAKKNNVFELVDFYAGSACDINSQFDFVAANILHHILIEIMEDLTKLIKPSGLIVLSGIIKEKEQDVLKSALNSGLKLIEIIEEDNWVAIVLKNTL